MNHRERTKGIAVTSIVLVYETRSHPVYTAKRRLRGL